MVKDRVRSWKIYAITNPIFICYCVVVAHVHFLFNLLLPSVFFFTQSMRVLIGSASEARWNPNTNGGRSEPWLEQGERAHVFCEFWVGAKIFLWIWRLSREWIAFFSCAPRQNGNSLHEHARNKKLAHAMGVNHMQTHMNKNKLSTLTLLCECASCVPRTAGPWKSSAHTRAERLRAFA